MHLKTWHIGLLMILVTLGTKAQTTCNLNLSGRIQYEPDTVNLPCQITLNDSVAIVSYQNGAFEMSGICPGTYTVLIRCGGNSVRIDTFHLSRDTSVTWSVRSEKILDHIDVSASRLDAQTLTKQTALSGKVLHASNGQTLADLASGLRGVNALKTGGTIAKPMISGFYGRRVVVYNNGVRLEGQDWGGEHGPEIDAGSTESIAVVKGPSALRYGPDAIGGLLLVNSFKQSDSSGIFGQIHTGGHSNGRGGILSGTLFGSTHKLPLYWFVEGTITRSGNQHTPDYYLKNTGASGSNLSAGFRYAGKRTGIQLNQSLYKTRIGIFTGSHIGNLTDLQTAFYSDKPFDSTGFSYAIDRPYQNVLHEQTSLEVTHHLNTKNTFTVSASRQYNKREEYDKDLPLNDSLAALNLPDFLLELTSYNTSIVWDNRINDHLSGSVGISAKAQTNTHEHREFIPNFTNQAAGIFWTERYRRKRFAIETGLRYDRNHVSVYQRNAQNEITNPKHLYQGATASVSWIYYSSRRLTLHSNVATGWRSPWVNELYSNGFHHGVAALEYGDGNLVPERSYSISFSPEFALKSLTISAEGFLSKIHDFIYLNPGKEPILTAQGAFPVFYYEQTGVFNRGFDFEAGWQIVKDFDMTLKSSVIRTSRINSSSVLPGTPPDRISLDGRYRFRVHGMSCYVATAFTHIAKQWRVKSDQDFVPLPAAYNILSASFSTEIPTQNGDIHIVLLVNNLMNTQYRDYLNRFRYYTDDTGRNFTLRVYVPFKIKKTSYEKN